MDLEVVLAGAPDGENYLQSILKEIAGAEPDLFGLPLPDKVQIENKYNEFVPLDLLRKQFILDFLDADGLREALCDPGL